MWQAGSNDTGEHFGHGYQKSSVLKNKKEGRRQNCSQGGVGSKSSVRHFRLGCTPKPERATGASKRVRDKKATLTHV